MLVVVYSIMYNISAYLDTRFSIVFKTSTIKRPIVFDIESWKRKKQTILTQKQWEYCGGDSWHNIDIGHGLRVPYDTNMQKVLVSWRALITFPFSFVSSYPSPKDLYQRAFIVMRIIYTLNKYAICIKTNVIRCE